MENFKMSDSITSLMGALSKFQSELPEIEPNAQGESTSMGKKTVYRYADLPHIKSIAEPILISNGLTISQPLTGSMLTTLLFHESGEYMASTGSLGNIQGQSTQQYGATITMVRRFAYTAILGISVRSESEEIAQAEDKSKVNDLNDVVINQIKKRGYAKK